MGYTKNELLIIDKVSLKDWYNKFIVPLGNKYRIMTEKGVGLCPFHDDNDPSLKVWGKKNLFHCFGCGFTGDVIASHVKFRNVYHNEKLTRESAVKQLAVIYGVELLEDDIKESNVFKDGLKYLEKDIPNNFNDLDAYSFSIFNMKVGKIENVDMRIKMYQDLDLRLSSKLFKG